MPAMDHHHNSSSFTRSFLSLRRDQLVEPQLEPNSTRDQQLDSFQQLISHLFSDLSTNNNNNNNQLLSLLWIRKLLEAFLRTIEEFGVILETNTQILSRPPTDRLISDFHDRSVKALDICNAICDGIHRIRHWHNHIEIVLIALNHPFPITEGQFRRAKKSLTDLSLLMLDSHPVQRNRSFSRSGTSASHFRSLSWSVSRNWSAARQLQAIGSNISMPRGSEVAASNGVANSVFAMNVTLHFVMWALVAAIPCQDRGLQTHFCAPKSFAWAPFIASLHERIVEEWRRKERKGSVGLLKEIYEIEKCVRKLFEVMEIFPLGEEKERELRKEVGVLSGVFDGTKVELEALESQVREVFHRIVRSRTEGLNCLCNNKS